KPLAPTGRETGISSRVEGVPGHGGVETVENPRHYQKAEKALAKAQKRLSRHKKRSKRWWQVARLLVLARQQARRPRRGFHQKSALALLRQCDVVHTTREWGRVRRSKALPVGDRCSRGRRGRRGRPVGAGTGGRGR